MDSWVGEIPVKSDFSSRFIEFLQSGLSRELVETVNYNIIDYQRNNGLLRTDRPVPLKREGMSRKAFDACEDIVLLNKSDGQVLKQLATYKEKNSLDMDEEADQWFMCITEGTVGGKVSEVLRG